jgi:hypothetical protein
VRAGKLGFLGELNVFVRTASKYDDCRVLRVPGLRLSVKLGWLGVGEPRDHHAVVPCAPTRLPEYSSNQVLHRSVPHLNSYGWATNVHNNVQGSKSTGKIEVA